MSDVGPAFSARREAIGRGRGAAASGASIGDVSAFDYLRRSDVTWADICERLPAAARWTPDVARQLEIRAKYEGYIARQDRQIERFAQLETS